MPRTLVEILALDQQDVFFASTLAWLLDPRQEHGLGTALLQELSMVLSEQDKPELALELSMAPAPAVDPKVAIVGGCAMVGFALNACRLALLISANQALKPEPVAEMLHIGRQPVVLLAHPSSLGTMQGQVPTWTFKQLADSLQQHQATPAWRTFVAQVRSGLEQQTTAEPMRPALPSPPKTPSAGASWGGGDMGGGWGGDAGGGWGAPAQPAASQTPNLWGGEAGSSVTDLWVQSEAEQAAAAQTEAARPVPEAVPEAPVGPTSAQTLLNRTMASGASDSHLPGAASLFAKATDSHLPDGTESLIDAGAEKRLKSPKDKSVVLLLTLFQKAVSMFRLYPGDHPLVTTAVDEVHTRLKEYHGFHGTLEVVVQRDGVYMGSERILKEDGNPSDFSFLLFPEGVRSLAFVPGIERKEVSDFAEVLSGGDMTVDTDLLSALWRRDFAHIQYLTYDQLSPAGLRMVGDPTLRGVAKRILMLTEAIIGPEDEGSEDLRFFLEGLEPANPIDPSTWPTLPKCADQFRQSPAGAARAELAAQLFDPFLGDNLGRAADLVAYASLQDEFEAIQEDADNFLGGSIQNALWYGNLEGVVDLLARGVAGTGEEKLSAGLSARLGNEQSLMLFSRLLQDRKDKVTENQLGQLGMRYLSRLDNESIKNVCRICGLQVDADVRKVFWRFLTSNLPLLLTVIDPLTLHSNPQVASEALKVLAQSGAQGMQRLRAYMEDDKNPQRAEQVREAVGQATGAFDLRKLLRVVAQYPIKEDRLKAARELRELKSPQVFAGLAEVVQQKEFMKREKDEMDLVLGTLTQVGGPRAVRVLQELSTRRGGLFGAKDAKRLNESAKQALAGLKKRRP